jgi:hypothetical protein
MPEDQTSGPEVRLTDISAYALRMMLEANFKPSSVVMMQPTRPITDDAPFVNLRTARHLESLGLALFDNGGADPEYEYFRLTDSGHRLAETLPTTAEASWWDDVLGRWRYKLPKASRRTTGTHL